MEPQLGLQGGLLAGILQDDLRLHRFLLGEFHVGGIGDANRGQACFLCHPGQRKQADQAPKQHKPFYFLHLIYHLLKYYVLIHLCVLIFTITFSQHHAQYKSGPIQCRHTLM